MLQHVQHSIPGKTSDAKRERRKNVIFVRYSSLGKKYINSSQILKVYSRGTLQRLTVEAGAKAAAEATRDARIAVRKTMVII